METDFDGVSLVNVIARSKSGTEIETAISILSDHSTFESVESGNIS